jgi:uncharacterized RDD family membrane protein YckC
MTSGSQRGTPGQPGQGDPGPVSPPPGGYPSEGAAQPGNQAQPDYQGQGQPGYQGQQAEYQGQPGGYPPGGGYAQPAFGGPLGVRRGSPVPVFDTRVTFRRIVQFVIDHILAGIVPAIIYGVIAGGRHGLLAALGVILAVAAWIVIMVWYWVLRPYGHGGQTFGMKLMGLRIVSKDGDRANRPQLVIRWIMLIIDTLFVGLVGLITMLCSRYRQRLGDHLARTLVVRSSWQADLGVQAMGEQAQAPIPGRTQ